MNEVHSWCFRLDVPPGDLSATLTDDEHERCARFRFERDRQRFIVAHGVLRRLLACYLGVRPEELRFDRNRFGKPRLAAAFDERLRFNLSHSRDLALIAVAQDAEVGVDVEYLRALPDLADDSEAFLRGWTRNEAYVKALGRGLGDEAAPDATGRWTFFSLQPAPGYIGAVAVEGRNWCVRRRAYFPNRSNR